jgi:hypothetical protein
MNCRTLFVAAVPSLFLLTGCIDVKPNWREYTSKDGRYSIQMPGAPRETQKEATLPPPFSGQLTVQMATVDLGNKAGYAVMYNDYPAAIMAQPIGTDQRLEGAVKGGVNAVKGTIVQQKSISLNGYPGREVQISSGDKKQVRTRIYLVKSRLYQVHVIGRDAATITSADADKFFNSFKLTR